MPSLSPGHRLPRAWARATCAQGGSSLRCNGCMQNMGGDCQDNREQLCTEGTTEERRPATPWRQQRRNPAMAGRRRSTCGGVARPRAEGLPPCFGGNRGPQPIPSRRSPQAQLATHVHGSDACRRAPSRPTNQGAGGVGTPALTRQRTLSETYFCFLPRFAALQDHGGQHGKIWDVRINSARRLLTSAMFAASWHLAGHAAETDTLRNADTESAIARA